MDTIPSLFSGSTTIEEGTRIADRYVVTGRLGAGGMGVVLKVADSKLHDEEVALKLLNPVHTGADPTTLKRMVNEVVVARSLTHPNIVRIHDIGETEQGCTYITMEYVKGQPLDELVKSRGNTGLPMATTIKFLSEILEGVAYAHKRGIIHRDIKPANILLTDEGEIKIVDFGLARSSGTDMSLTKTGEAVGTPAFMAPEQFRGAGIDQRADVYALGIMAYQLATGNLPFNCETFFDMALKHMNSPLPNFAQESGNVPAWFEEIVQKAAAKKPEDRYFDASEFLEALAKHSDDSVQNVTRLMRLSGAHGESLDSVYRLKSVHAENNEARVEEGTETATASRKFTQSPLFLGLSSLSILFVLALIGWNTFSASPDESPVTVASSSPEIAAKKAEIKEKKAQEAKEQMAKDLRSELDSYVAALPIDSMVLPEERETKPEKAPVVSKETPAAQKPVAAPASVTPPPRNIAAPTRNLAVASVRNTRAPRQGVDLLGTARKAYTGEMKPIGGGGSPRTLTLDIAVNGNQVSGKAVIKGLGNFDVVGQKTARGYDMTLVGRAIEVVLNGGERKERLRGTYSIPKQNKNGSWNARLLR